MRSAKDLVSEYLSKSGRTKASLSSELGFDYNTLRNKLDGKTQFTFSEIVKLADILECSTEEFRDSVVAPLPAQTTVRDSL